MAVQGGKAGVFPREGFRRDIEGLRAIAVLLVVLHHLGGPLVRGGYVGVDVFFVISGFLITKQLLRELASRGTISIPGFYARRALRLLPAATLAIGAVIAATAILLPLRVTAVRLDALAAAGYAVNLLFATRGQNYFAPTPRSPLEHYWSLAVEEQFYLIWPAMLLLVSLRLGRGRAGSHRAAGGRRVAVALSVIAAVSFGMSAWLTWHSTPWAYFGTHARIWELAIGAFCALGAGAAARAPSAVAAGLTWLGLCAIVAAGALFTASTRFPGFSALIPVLGAAAVISGGCAKPRAGVEVALRWPPIQTLGRLSYSWYLWHWPIIVFAAVALDRPLAGWEPAAVGLGSLGVAAAAYALVERPVRTCAALRTRASRGLALGAACTVAAAGLVAVAPRVVPEPVGPGEAVLPMALSPNVADPASSLSRILAASERRSTVPSNLSPSLTAAIAESPFPYDEACDTDVSEIEPRRSCVLGDQAAERTMVVIGDSHARHWIPALDEIARRRGLRLRPFVKSACPAADAVPIREASRQPYAECQRWRRLAFERIAALRPSMIVMSSSDGYGAATGSAGDIDAFWAAAWGAAMRELRPVTPRLVLIRDTPRLRADVLDCVSAHLRRVDRCGSPRARALAQPRRRALIAGEAAARGVATVEPVPWFCGPRICPAIVGNIIVFRDGHHLTGRFSRLLAPLLERALRLDDPL